MGRGIRSLEREGRQRPRRCRVPLGGRRLRTVDRRDRDQPGHRPVFRRADPQLHRIGRCRPRCRRLAPRGVGGDPGADHRPPRRPCDLRAARARLLDRRHVGPRRGARHLPGLHARQRGYRAAARARRRRHQHRAPAADLRHRHDRGGPCRPGPARLRPGVVRTRRHRPAGLHRGDRRRGRLQLGLRPVPLLHPGGVVRRRRRGRGARARVPRDGRRAARHGPAGRARPGVQPHRPVGAGGEVGARQGGAGLLPPSEPRRRGGDLHLLRERRDRA